MLRKSLSISLYISVAIIIIAAVLVSVIRLYPDSYKNYLPDIQEKISTIVGRPVTINNLQLDWIGTSPHVTVENLSVYSDESKQRRILFVKEANLSINIYKSILNKRINFNQLKLNGGNLRVVRTISRKIILNDIDISEFIDNRKKSNEKTNIEISLIGSTIDIQDHIKGLDYFFDRVNILLKVHKDTIKVASTFLLPEKLGESLIVEADLDGYDDNLNELKGKFYTKGMDINLELLGVFFPQLQLGIEAGNSNFEIWGDVRSESKRTVLGTISFSDLHYKPLSAPLSSIRENSEVTEFNTKFKIVGNQSDWTVFLNDTLIRAGDTLWLGENYELRCKECDGNNFNVAASLDYVDIESVLSTAQHFKLFTKEQKRFLNNNIVLGKIIDSVISVQISDGRIEKYLFNASLQDMSVSVPNQQFSLESLNGHLAGSHVNGELSIDSESMNIKSLKLLNEPLVNQTIRGTIKWQHMPENTIIAFQDISLLTQETLANIQGTVQVTNGNAYIDLQGHVPYGEVNIVKKYLPYKKMHPKLAKWLDYSIKSGKIKNGKLLFQGNPKLFPFKNNPGRFEVLASIENGLLDYRKEWPPVNNVNAEFKIKNKQLNVKANYGKVLDTKLHNVEANIEDMKLTRLVINGNANGDASDILDYLRISSLLPKNSQVYKYISADGNVKLGLNIILTFSRKIKKERTVTGVIEFDDTNLTITSMDTLPFTNLDGKLYFDQQGAEGRGLTARLYNNDFKGEAYKSGDGRTILNLSGIFDFDTYFNENHDQFHEYIQGEAPLNATVNIPALGKQADEKSLQLTVDTSLEGAVITLPTPFKKNMEEHKNLYANAKFEAGVGHPIYASYDNKVFMKSIYDQERKNIAAMELRFGDDQFKMPDSGLRISGHMDQLDLSPWMNISKNIGVQNKNKLIEVSEVDIFAKSLSVSNLKVNELTFKLDRDKHSWVGDVRSSIANGNFNYPVDAKSGVAATGNFDFLSFTKSEKKSDIAIDPRKIPPLIINSKKFTLDQYSFDDIVLKTKPGPSGMIVESLTGKGDQLNVTASGVWDIDPNNKQSTQIDIELVSENLQSSINGLGYETLIEKGEGYVISKLNWPGAPHQFSTGEFLGTAKIRFKDGEFSSVNPGAGRFIGLVNLAEISKRLSLDFKDFFSKGYVFDKMRGDVLFKEGNLTTENLNIEGSSADILIEGRTGLVAKDYDQIITVTPHISGGLPWVGLAVGGPIGAVGVIVGEKVAETIGVDVDKVTQVKYSMTGKWDDPKLEPISKKVTATSSSKATQGQPSPQQTMPNNAK